jgi:hypothetical protein
MKDTSEANYIIGIEIQRDMFKMILDLSHKAYIERVLKKFKLSQCKANTTSIVNGDKFNLN